MLGPAHPTHQTGSGVWGRGLLGGGRMSSSQRGPMDHVPLISGGGGVSQGGGAFLGPSHSPPQPGSGFGGRSFGGEGRRGSSLRTTCLYLGGGALLGPSHSPPQPGSGFGGGGGEPRASI